MQRSTKLEACTWKRERERERETECRERRKQVEYRIEEERDRVIGAMGHLHGAVNKGMRVYLIPFPLPSSQDVICLVQTHEEGGILDRCQSS